MSESKKLGFELYAALRDVERNLPISDDDYDFSFDVSKLKEKVWNYFKLGDLIE